MTSGASSCIPRTIHVSDATPWSPTIPRPSDRPVPPRRHPCRRSRCPSGTAREMATGAEYLSADRPSVKALSIWSAKEAQWDARSNRSDAYHCHCAGVTASCLHTRGVGRLPRARLSDGVEFQNRLNSDSEIWQLKWLIHRLHYQAPRRCLCAADARCFSASALVSMSILVRRSKY